MSRVAGRGPEKLGPERVLRPRRFLEEWCQRMDGGPYSAYRDLRGGIQLDGLVLEMLRAQPDPFANPSRIRLLIPYGNTGLDSSLGELSGGTGARRPGLVDSESARAVAVRDFLGRWIGQWLEDAPFGRGPGAPPQGGRRAALQIEPHGQQVLDRSAVLLHRDHFEVRLFLDLPAKGRRILGREALRLLCDLPERCVRECLDSRAFDTAALEQHIETVEDFAYLQEELERQNWIAFVADGSHLARRAGNDDRPLAHTLDSSRPEVPFLSPASLRREVRLPHGGAVEGMALEPGVVLLCGGGFHGKSTLLRALAAAVVPHVRGDGRERVACRGDAQSIRAEDGRAVSEVDLRPFVGELPFREKTDSFSTENASGSTSQAASILESIQGGSRLLLLDEDTSATNFMIRDSLMEQLLEPHQEPITPFLARARTLYEKVGVSSVLVLGGSGEYFRVADRVLVLDTYRPIDRTSEAKRLVVARPPLSADSEAGTAFARSVDPSRFLPRGPGERIRVRALGSRSLLVDRIPLDLVGLEALRELAQARYLARVLAWRSRELSSPGGREKRQSVRDLTAAYLAEWETGRLDGFHSELGGDLAAVRVYDLLAAVNRLRSCPPSVPGTAASL